MKKIVSVLIALMLLVTSVAMAENAFKLADPVVAMFGGEEEQYAFDLTGLELIIAGGEIGEKMAVRIDAYGNGETLCGLTANVADGVVLFAIDGVNGVYSMPIPEELGSAVDNVNFSNIDLDSIDIDTEKLMEIVMNGVEMDENGIRVPYTTVNEVLDLVIPALKDVEIPGVDIDEALESIAELKESDSGVTLVGNYESSETGFSCEGSVLPVQNGVEGEAIFDVGFEMAGDTIAASFEVPGEANGYFMMAPSEEEEDSAVITIGGAAEGFEGVASFVIGSVEEDVELVELDGSDAIDVESMSEEQQGVFYMSVMGAAGGLISFVSNAMGADAA